MKLCGFRVSNYHNKVRLVLLEKGIQHEEETNCFPSQSPEFLARSPMGKAPFLETKDGVLCESQVICEYLEDAYPEKPLYPRDPFARGKVRELLQVLEMHVELVIRRTYGALFFGGSITDEAKQEIRKDLDKGLRAFQTLVKFDPFIAGSELTMADCAAAVHFPLISMASKKAYGDDVVAAIPGASAYLERMAARPHVAQVYADRDAAFKAMFSR